MSDLIYYCTKENNICPKKETCTRYIEAENKNNATLFKTACIEDNNYVLYIKHETEADKENDKKE